MKKISSIGLSLLIALVIIGCSKPYTIIQPLEEPIAQPALIRFGSFVDQLPISTPDDKKPTLDDITKFKVTLLEHLLKTEVFAAPDSNSTVPIYEVRGSIIEYKRGNGFMRFMFGMGIGSAKLLTHLELVRTNDSHIVFSGDFAGYVGDGLVSGSDMYKQVAKDFSNALKKDNEKQPKS